MNQCLVLYDKVFADLQIFLDWMRLDVRRRYTYIYCFEPSDNVKDLVDEMAENRIWPREWRFI